MNHSLNTPIRNFQLHMRHENNIILNGVFYEFPDEEKKSVSSISVEMSSKKSSNCDPHKFLVEASFLLAREINNIEKNSEIVLDFPISPTSLNFALYVSNGVHLLWRGEYRFVKDPSFTLRSYFKSHSKGIDTI